MCIHAKSQDSLAPKTVVMVVEYDLPERTVMDSLLYNFSVDSLLNIYVTRGIVPNRYVLNHRILYHIYGANSHRVMFIYEVDGYHNIFRAEEETVSLINAFYSDKAQRKRFWNVFNRLFDRHDDRVMAELLPRK